MNIIQSMINEKLGEVRIITSEDGNVMNTEFCALDVARILGYNNNSIRNAINRHCKGVSKRHILTNGGEQIVNFIKLPDVFRLIDRSNMLEAVEFQNWLYNEVLPSLYQFGTYTMENHIDNLQLTNPIFDPKNVTELSLQEQNNHITTISDYGNGMEFDNFNLTRDVCIVIGQLLQQVCNQQNQTYQMMIQNQQNMFNSMNDRLNNIESEVKEIKQMIIPAVISKQ